VIARSWVSISARDGGVAPVRVHVIAEAATAYETARLSSASSAFCDALRPNAPSSMSAVTRAAPKLSPAPTVSTTGTGMPATSAKAPRTQQPGGRSQEQASRRESPTRRPEGAGAARGQGQRVTSRRGRTCIRSCRPRAGGRGHAAERRTSARETWRLSRRPRAHPTRTVSTPSCWPDSGWSTLQRFSSSTRCSHRSFAAARSSATNSVQRRALSRSLDPSERSRPRWRTSGTAVLHVD
jgi:hypothetical protein